MKILLFALNSSYTQTNLAVRCIKKSLVTAGFSAEIYEFNLKDRKRRVLEALVSAHADVYGFSAYIWNVRELYSFAADLKKLRPEAKIVFGGPEVSFDALEVLSEHGYIDCVITGEGEAAFVTAVRLLSSGKVLPPIIEGGIFEGFREQGILYSKDELNGNSRVVYYESSRGCPYRCAYCLSSVSGKVRAKDAEVTLSELKEFENVGNVKIVKFVDRTFNFDRGRAKEIWRGLLSGTYTKTYHFEICADLLDEESFAILSQFPKGKIQLEIGVQSTNREALSRVDRSPDTDRLIANITRLYRMGNMHIHADLIAGLPGENFESFGHSFDALYGKCHMLQLGFLKLLRGSKLRREADSFGCVYSDEPPYEVLSTDCLSYSELCCLHAVDELADRYCGGAFSRSMALIMSRTESPFYLFCRFADSFVTDRVHITECSQPRAYEKLYEYLHKGDDRELAEALTLDFLTSQKMLPPSFDGVGLKKADTGLKRRFMEWADSCGIAYFAPALEEWSGVREYVVDRRNMRAYLCFGADFAEL